MKFLAEIDPEVQKLFGGITPPDAMNIGGNDAASGLNSLISFGIRMFILVAGFFLLLYLLWGALDWISSGGEKEKITKAQNKITNALIGMVLIFVVLVVFNLLAVDILGIFGKSDTGQGFKINLPKLGE